MVKISETEVRRQMEEILRRQLERPRLRPSEEESSGNPFETSPRSTGALHDEELQLLK
jgi:hypothetical protein